MSETKSTDSNDAFSRAQTSTVGEQLDSVKNNYWKPSFETLYDSYFQELLASEVADRWQRIDFATNLLVAFTASGSVIAGWTLWNQVGWRAVWLAVAGFASMASITHGLLSVPARIKDQEDLRQQFSRLRVDLETFRYNLQIMLGSPPHVPIAFDDVHKGYNALRDRYANYITRARRDMVNTPKLRIKIQKEVNKLLEDKTRAE